MGTCGVAQGAQLDSLPVMTVDVGTESERDVQGGIYVYI